MLKIHFGALDGEIKKPSGYFDLEYEDEWFEDPFVKEMVLDVDKTQVITAYNMISPVLGGINYKSLSGGVKNLILAYKTDKIIDASHCGDNCAKWLLAIGARKDLTVSLYHIMRFFGNHNTTKEYLDTPMEAYILNTKKHIHTYREYIEEALLCM